MQFSYPRAMAKARAIYTCGNCGGVLLFVADGPQPGWWEHDLVPDEAHPCRGAVPQVTR